MKNEQHVLNELLPLLEKDEKNKAYFFSNTKDPVWLEPLRKKGLFDPSTIPAPIRTAKGYTLVGWAPAPYLEHISKLIYERNVIDQTVTQSLLSILRAIDSTSDNDFLARQLFLMMMRLPPSVLSPKEVEQAFSWFIGATAQETLIEYGVYEGFDLLVSRLNDSPHDRSIFRAFFRALLTSTRTKPPLSGELQLVFFSRHGLEKFTESHFKVASLAREKPFILIEALDEVEAALSGLLSADPKLDEMTPYWRPAVEDHPQNEFHDSAPSVLVGFIAKIATALNGITDLGPKITSWKESSFLTFKRIYLSLAAVPVKAIQVNDAASLITQIGLISKSRHEIYHFLARQFDQLPGATMDRLLDLIDAIDLKLNEDAGTDKRYTAWEKLRWLEAIRTSTYPRAIDLRKACLAITEGQTPDHPDFSVYMGGGWVGPNSPKSKEELAALSGNELFQLLDTFKDSDDFRAPSSDGLARALEEFVATDPMKASGVLPNLERLRHQYISSIFDGYSKAWNEKKFVPIQELISKIEAISNLPKFAAALQDKKSKASWVVSSIARFTEAGTRDDERAFPPEMNSQLQRILEKCISLCAPNDEYVSYSDGFTRAINEPRGKIFEALIILALRKARLAAKDTPAFEDAWASLRTVIEPILKRKDEREVSLHAMIGAHYRQFAYLNSDWVYLNIDLIAPPQQAYPNLWRGFMDGFSYVAEYSKRMYDLLKDRGHLLAYLRYQAENDKLDRLQDRVIELAVTAFILGHEVSNEGVIGSILSNKDPDEWHHVIWVLRACLGASPKPEHLQKAKELLNLMLDTKDNGELGEKWKDYFKGLGGFLERLPNPSETLVRRIFDVVASDTESPWENSDLIEYLHEYRESHPRIVGELFVIMLQVSGVAPTYPPEKVRAICEALAQRRETATMIQICKIYSERSLSCEPIRDICENLK